MYPLHLLTLFVFIFIELLKLFAVKYTSFETTYVPFDGFNNFFLISNLFLIHGWYGWSYNPKLVYFYRVLYILIFALVICNFVNQKNFYFNYFSLSTFLLNMALKHLLNLSTPQDVYIVFLLAQLLIIFSNLQKRILVLYYHYYSFY